MSRLVVCLIAFALPAFAVGCGGGETTTPSPATVEGTVPQETEAASAQGDPAAGKQVYESAGCGSCHVFTPAGSEGTVGPDLDQANVNFEDAVTQIENGGGGMPAFKDQLSEKEITDVAAFVTQDGG